MEIVRYPDPRLRQKNARVEVFDEELASLVKAMFAAMYRTEGVGLAAPQVGINKQLLVYNPHGSATKPEGEIALVNPRLVTKGRQKELGEEGCLSFPGIYGQVERPVFVKVEAQDLQGQPITLELKDWDARIFLHEFDHLDGILFIDRMTPSDRNRNKHALEDMKRHYAESGASS